MTSKWEPTASFQWNNNLCSRQSHIPSLMARFMSNPRGNRWLHKIIMNWRFFWNLKWLEENKENENVYSKSLVTWDVFSDEAFSRTKELWLNRQQKRFNCLWRPLSVPLRSLCIDACRNNLCRRYIKFVGNTKKSRGKVLASLNFFLSAFNSQQWHHHQMPYIYAISTLINFLNDTAPSESRSTEDS